MTKLTDVNYLLLFWWLIKLVKRICEYSVDDFFEKNHKNISHSLNIV